jgi:excinuclease ABC subunit B
MVTDSMQQAIEETRRRRELQLAYNAEHGITPETIRKAIRRGIEEEIAAQRIVQQSAGIGDESQYVTQEYLNELEAEMLAAAEKLEFERAAQLRDRILDLKRQLGQKDMTGDANKPGFLPPERPKRTRRGSGKRVPRGRGGGRLPKPERP